MNSRDDALRCFGTDEPSAESRTLRAGLLSCTFADGAVRGLHWGEVEIVRGIAYLLRDTHWGTAPGRVDSLQVREEADRFEVLFDLGICLDEAELVASARIEGRADGSFEFVVDAASDRDLASNRCGFVVLHPAGFAGKSLRVTHTNGQSEETSFPREISPSQPVLDIRAMAYSIDSQTLVTCTLEADLPGRSGDKFEMEDQRNWSDASYKTYVGSLLDPWPYVLPALRSFRQRVHLDIDDGRASSDWQEQTRTTAASVSDAHLVIGGELGVCLPEFGIGVPENASAMTTQELAAVDRLRPAWLVAQATLQRFGLAADLAVVAALAERCSAAVQLDVLCPEGFSPDECAQLAADVCARVGLAPAAVRFCPAEYLKSYQPSDRWPEVPPLEQYAVSARAAFPQARIGGGMVAYFTELNRKRQSARGLDFIGHTICPIVHAADDASVMETLESLPQITHSIRHIWPTLGHRVGPVTLAMARNPYGDATRPNPESRRLPLAAIDPRHQGLFGAAWSAACAAALVPSGIELLALLDAHGASGPMLARSQPGWRAGATVPAWLVARVLARASGSKALACKGLPRGLANVTWMKSDSRATLLLANTTGASASFTVDRPMKGRVLDATTFDAAVGDIDWFDDPAEAKLQQRFSLAAYGVLVLHEPNPGVHLG